MDTWKRNTFDADFKSILVMLEITVTGLEDINA